MANALTGFLRAGVRRVLDAAAARIAYRAKLAQETANYRDVVNVSDLPAIYSYWSEKYLRPLLEAQGFPAPDPHAFAKYLAESAARIGDDNPTFISIGSGNCDGEVRIATMMKQNGLQRFVIECLDMNPHMLARGRALAAEAGLLDHLRFVEGDFNKWRPTHRYAGVMANQSLHHVVELEALFDAIKDALAPNAYFVTSDMIGRNGHQRWPEALAEVHRFWRELPPEYRYNQQLKRDEELYENWDCSTSGFEGIRAQDIVPLLRERFEFRLFVGFANVIDVFIDRGFGHNFSAERQWDRDFIDRVAAADEAGIVAGKWTPTHMIAVLTNERGGEQRCARGVDAARAVRKP